MKNIIIPGKFMGVPVSEETMKEVLQGNVPKPTVAQPQANEITPASNNIAGKDRYVILPSQKHGNHEYPDLLVAMDITHQRKEWPKSWDELLKEGAFMLNLRQYVDFLNLLRSGKKVYDEKGNQLSQLEVDELYKDITELRAPNRREWLDAEFESGIGGTLSICYHRIENGNLVKVEEPLEDCLMCAPRNIDLTDWLNNANNQGLPPSGILDGKVYYAHPERGTVTYFGTSHHSNTLCCGVGPSSICGDLGVRAARVKN